MSKWESIEEEHLPLLKNFKCVVSTEGVAEPWKLKSYKISKRIQDMVQNPGDVPYHHPTYGLVKRISDEGIEAFIRYGYEGTEEPNVYALDIYVLAVHSEAKRTGVAKEAVYTAILNTKTKIELNGGLVSEILVRGEIHKNNVASREMAKKYGAEDLGPTGLRDHQKWGASVLFS